MNDRDLLEAAAKAAGIVLHAMAIKPATGDGDGFIGYMTDASEWPRGWFDPLTDDGDALRLAVKLRFDISQLTMDGQQVLRILGPLSIDKTFEIVEDDPYAATRRAIVRAAAAIGAAS